MTPAEIDQIHAAYQRACSLGSIPEAKRISAVAQALGYSVEVVRQALAEVV